MYPTLSYFFQDVFGVNIPLPIQSYGLMVALGFITGAYFLNYEFKRKEKLGIFLPIYKQEKVGEPASPLSIIISLLVGFILGFKLVAAALNYSGFVDNPQTFILSGTGNIWGGIIIGLGSGFYTWWEKNKTKLPQPKLEERKILPHELTGNILVVAGISGILGAKLFHNLENFDALMADPIGEIFSFSGLTFLGGVIMGFTVTSIYLYRNNISVLHTLDIAAVFMPITYAIGRMGCQVAGDGCWGIPNPNPKPGYLSWLPDWLWAYDYPHNVVGEGVAIADCTGKYCTHLDVPVFPTSLYESISMIIIFLIMWNLRNRIKIPLVMFSIYLMFSGIERFLVEQIRVNTKYHIFGGGVTQAEIISTLMFLAGLGGLIYILLNKQKVIDFAKVQIKEINKPSLKNILKTEPKDKKNDKTIK